MKTIFTFLLIVFISICSYAQKTTSSGQNKEQITSVIMPEAQSFKITKVYPNPVKNYVSVELQSEVTGVIEVKLFNILGTEIKKWDPIFLSQVDQKLKIDLSFVKSGVYILKISSAGQTCTSVLKKI